MKYQTVFVCSLLVAPALHAQDYPAANFQPKVIYSAVEAVSQSSSAPCTPKAEQTQLDPKYPAASFQPKIIYSSADAR